MTEQLSTQIAQDLGNSLGSAGAKIFPNILMWLAAVFVSFSSQVNSFSDAVLSLQGPSSRIPMSYLLGNWLLRGKKIKASNFLRSEVSVSSIIERLSEKQRNKIKGRGRDFTS